MQREFDLPTFELADLCESHLRNNCNLGIYAENEVKLSEFRSIQLHSNGLTQFILMLWYTCILYRIQGNVISKALVSSLKMRVQATRP